MYKDRRVIAIMLVAAFSLMAISPIFASAKLIAPGGHKNGPYVDKIVYNVIEGDDQQVLALQNDEIDLIGDMVDPTHLPTLEGADNIEVANVRRNGIGYVTIKTDKYPFNITNFRRAIAFALDKQAISDDAWDGLSDPQDSCVPIVNPFSCEGLLPYTYYEANVELGNAMLDAEGFDIDPLTGYRNAPNGEPFDVLVECADSSNVAIEVGSKVAEALVALHVDATSQPTDFYEYLYRLYYHDDFDIVFLGTSYTTFDIDFLAYEYWSEYAYRDYYNFACWQNATYDSWRDQLLHSTDYEDVYEAAFKMQEIWVYSCPEIVCYENFELSAYRTDKFEGYVNDVSGGVPGWWTNQKVHLKPGQPGAPWGGEFRWSNPKDIDTFNFMTSTSGYTSNVLNEFYDSLLTLDEFGNLIPWIAESYKSETHADNAEIPAGYTRLTFDMIQNATWTDGLPMTANDVVYSLNYFRDADGNPYQPDLVEMTAAYAPTNYRIIVEFETESYWHVNSVGYKPILPKHFFLTIGEDGWNTWDPHPPTEAMVTSGPFNVSDYVQGEFCELTYFPNYVFGLDRDQGWITETTTAPETTTSVVSTTTTTSAIETTTTTTTSEQPTTQPSTPDLTMAIVAGAVGAAVVILVGGYVLLRQK
jgi:ABC-type transport system substrate-binding protein